MPSLRDDDRIVMLDLHGSTVREAEDLLYATLREAARRGRGQVTVIHGASTSDPRYRNRTIKHTLYDLLDRGALPAVTGALRQEGRTVLSLDVTATRDPTPLRLRDVW